MSLDEESSESKSKNYFKFGDTRAYMLDKHEEDRKKGTQFARQYFVVGRSLRPIDFHEVDEVELGEGEVMLEIPVQVLEELANHLVMSTRKENRVRGKEGPRMSEGPISHTSFPRRNE